MPSWTSWFWLECWRSPAQGAGQATGQATAQASALPVPQAAGEVAEERALEPALLRDLEPAAQPLVQPAFQLAQQQAAMPALRLGAQLALQPAAQEVVQPLAPPSRLLAPKATRVRVCQTMHTGAELVVTASQSTDLKSRLSHSFATSKFLLNRAVHKRSSSQSVAESATSANLSNFSSQ